MKHYIDAPAGSEEFKHQFRAVRDAFLEELRRWAEVRGVLVFRACQNDGTPFDWIWEDSEFKHSRSVGRLSDALGFAAAMIDQGMCFAFMGTPSSTSPDAITIWLTTWEAPDTGPKWPLGTMPVFEVVHDGVFRGGLGET